MRILFIILIGVSVGVATRAQERGGGRGSFPAPNIGFNTIDSDADGALSSTEIAAAPTALAKLDRNSDGQITSDEVRMVVFQGRGRGGRGGGPGESERRADGQQAGNAVEETVTTLMSFDANGDGKLSKTELPERFQGIFDRADANKDGFLTPDEIRNTLASQTPPSETGGRGGPDAPRRPINFIRMDPVLAAVDTNGDGTISADEIRDAPDALRKLDANRDGTVSREEASVRQEQQSDHR